jgi:hypothetical protein
LRAILHFTFIEVTIICAILLGIYWDDDEIRSEVLTVWIGLICCAVVFLLLFKIKQNFDKYSKTAIPALVVFCWIFLYLPFTGVVPSSAFYLSKNDEDWVVYERLLAAFIAFLIMVGISLIAILGYLYFRRRDFEKKFKFIASKVIKKLAKNHVKSDYHVINLAYQGYVSMGEGIVN